jgi:hypothetical protein
MLPESDYRFDRELAEWFSRRGGAWSGTAGELLASLRISADAGDSFGPQSSAGLYAHLQSHKQVLLSLGVDVLLRHGVPRMVSLRSCQDEQSQRKPPSSTLSIARKSDPAITPSSLSSAETDRKNCSGDSADTDVSESEEFKRDIPVAKSESAGKPVTGKSTYGDGPKEGFFVNTGEALFAIVEMRRQIREQGLDLESAVDLVIGRARQITRSCGIAVGFLPEEIGGRLGTGVATSRKELNFHANLFRSSLVAGEAVQLPDAQKHPLLGATCRREGIGSLIMLPIFRSREVAGAIEFFFQEKRSFSPGDVMDLGLIAGVISESLGGSRQIGVKHASGPPVEIKIVANVERTGNSLNEKADPGEVSPGTVEKAIDPETVLTESSTRESMAQGSLTTKLATAPAQIWLTFKRVWTRHARGA